MSAELVSRNVQFRYRAGPSGWLVDIPEFVIREDAAISLLGDNMAGKTSFLKFLAGTIDSDAIEGSGLVSWQNRTFSAPPPAITMRELGLVVVNQIDPMFPELSTIENIVISAPHKVSRSLALARAREVVNRFERLYSSPNLGSIPLGRLSGGARGMIRILRAISWPHRVLFLDEPTVNLDEGNRNRVFEILSEFLQPRAAVLLVSHIQKDHDLLTDLSANRNMTRTTFRFQNRVSHES